MAGDYTRFTFDPTDLFTGLHKQQGRVSLDSDFNEFEEMLDRHTRSEMYDTVGQAVVPDTTPNGFAIGVSGVDLTIGIGRMYVDGLQPECFGDMSSALTTVFKVHEGGVEGAGPLLYPQQPFFYQPVGLVPIPAFPTISPTAGIINLVYLDVWQREVTVFEDDGLREPALNGPDTATRVQTAWQVKVLRNADAGSCTVPPPTWDALIAPSTARMTAQVAPAPPAPGPCVINPVGGYTGIENRLYRVEIHRGGLLTGAPGAHAQFKWSRDNASLAARVLSVSPGPIPTQSVITVTSTGRDAWMRFEIDNHIELLDDFVEFAMRESGSGGPMARVLAVNHATGEITVDRNLTAFAIVPARHPRIRRWDAASAAEPLLRDTDNGTVLTIEEGITITFGNNPTDTVHAGDFWVFAARTADGSIDTVVNAPPRGILHHFARLALVTSGAPPTVLTDCRTPWPPAAGCCTRVVRPGQSIQAAIDSLPPAGGCVCLKVGIHNITVPIELNRSNVHLHGESEGAEIHGAPGMFEAMFIAPPGATAINDVMVADIRIVMPSNGAGGGIGIEADDVNRLSIRGVEVVIGAGPGGGLPDFFCGLYVDDCADVVLENNTMSNAMWGVFIGDIASRCHVMANTMNGPTFELASLMMPFGEFGVLYDSSLSGDHRIERNVITSYQTGVSVEEDSAALTIAFNRIVRTVRNAVSGDPVPFTAADLRLYLNDPKRFYAIDVLGGRFSRVHDNYIELHSDLHGGVRVLVDQVLVRANTIVSSLPEKLLTMPPGIYCGANGATGNSGTASTIIENSLQGPTTGIVVSLCTAVAVSENRIDGQGRGWFAVRLDDCSFTTVTGQLVANVLLPFTLSEGDHNVVNDNRMALALIGILVIGESNVTLNGNEITGAAFGGIIALIDFGDCSFARNRIVNCGWVGLGPIQGGILAFSLFPVVGDLSSLRVESCEIVQCGVAPDGTLATTAVYGILSWFANCQVVNNRVVYDSPNLSPALEHRALLLIGPLNVNSDLARPEGPGALICGNVFRGRGNTNLVQIFQFGLAPTPSLGFWFDKAVFTSNVCDHLGTVVPAAGVSTVLLGVRWAAVTGNTVCGPRAVISISGDGVARGSAVGNATTGAITNFNATVPAPVGNNFAI